MYAIIEVEWYDHESIAGLSCNHVFTDEKSAEDYQEILKKEKNIRNRDIYIVELPL